MLVTNERTEGQLYFRRDEKLRRVNLEGRNAIEMLRVYDRVTARQQEHGLDHSRCALDAMIDNEIEAVVPLHVRQTPGTQATS